MNALRTLQQLDFEAKCAARPSIPQYAIPRTLFSDGTANGLTRAILRWFELHNHWATRINTTGRYIQGKVFTDFLGRQRQLPGHWVKGTTRKGTADIHAVICGRHVSIEVKVGQDRMSEAQLKTKRAIEASGGLYFVASDFEGFVKWYEQAVRVHTGPQQNAELKGN